jgi:hypothetical protein
MFRFLSADFTVTKRLLGLLLLAIGLALIVGMVAAEYLNSRSGGFGTLQKLGTLAGAASMVIGLSLLPLGNQPA